MDLVAVLGVAWGTQGSPKSSKNSPACCLFVHLLTNFGAFWGQFVDDFVDAISTQVCEQFLMFFEANGGAAFQSSKSTSEGLRRQKVDLQQHWFSLHKTSLFDLGGCPRAPKLSSELLSESISFFGGLRDRKVTPNGTKTGPGRQPHRCKTTFFLSRILERISKPKRATGGGLRSQAEPGPGGTPLDHESIILRYVEV